MKNKILVIEDKVTDLISNIEGSLIQQGYVVETASGVKQAYLKMDEFQPELVIMVRSNTEDVKDVCTQLRRSFPSFVLLIGTEEDGTVWERSVDAGADFYLIYPFSFMEFEARVKALLRRQNIYTNERSRRSIPAKSA